jgi:hypothetical protein
MDVRGQLHNLAALLPENEPTSTHWIWVCVGNKFGPHAVEKRKISCPYRESNFGHPTRRYIVSAELSDFLKYMTSTEGTGVAHV